MPHIHELIDFTVSAYIVHPSQDKVLQVYHPRYSRWLPVGGHIELHENPDEALLREVKEESGLDVEVLCERLDAKDPGQLSLWRPSFMDIHEANSPHRHIALIYICLAKSDVFTKSDEHTEMRWLDVHGLKALTPALSKQDVYYAEQAIATAKESK